VLVDAMAMMAEAEAHWVANQSRLMFGFPQP
jgi:hypothetical protein